MSLKQLCEGAILIADAHCAPWRTDFIDFLRALEAKTLQTSQLILMGDVLDMLYGPIERTHPYNRESIELLNRLSESMEIIYLEGNHDFLLTKLLPNITVIPRQEQPFRMEFEGKQVALSHGDTCMGWGYELYTALIRNRGVLAMLRLIDKIGKGFIVDRLATAMQKKSHCRRIDGFEGLIGSRMEKEHHQNIDVLIEGHFHQNVSFEMGEISYINLGAFACNERYFTVQSIQNQPILREAMFRKEPI